MRYASPVITDFGSIAAHTFSVGTDNTKNHDAVPGHIDIHGECSGGSGEETLNCNLL